jgi:hypothetical protein
VDALVAVAFGSVDGVEPVIVGAFSSVDGDVAGRERTTVGPFKAASRACSETTSFVGARLTT